MSIDWNMFWCFSTGFILGSIWMGSALYVVIRYISEKKNRWEDIKEILN